MPAGAPLGNQNGLKQNRLWSETIRRAVTQADGEKLRKIADKLIDLAAEGDIQAMKEIGDRLDGKAAQTISGDPDAPLVHKIERVIVDGSSSKDA